MEGEEQKIKGPYDPVLHKITCLGNARWEREAKAGLYYQNKNVNEKGKWKEKAKGGPDGI